MPSRTRRGTSRGDRVPALFSAEMDNSVAAQPGRRGRSPASGAGSPRTSARNSRRRLDLVADGTPNRSNDGSGARTPRTGGGDQRPNVEGQPIGDGPDNDYNPDEFLDSLKASEQPMLLQMAAYLSAKDETIAALQQQVKAEQDKRKTQESIRNYEDTGRSSFQFHPDDIADLMHTFVIPHIRELDDQKYYSDLDMATALPEDLSRGISMVTNLPKNVKNPIFQRNLRSNQLSTLPRECSDLESKYYSVEQKSKDDALVKLHKDFAPVLQVLLHTSLQTLREPDDTVSAETLLSDVQNSAFDLCQILFEFFGKTIVQPRREIFQKATGLSVSHNTSSGFLTRAESEAAMTTARQHDLIGTHIDAVRPNSAFGRGRGKGKNGRRGAQRPAGRGHGQLRQLQSVRPTAPPTAPPAPQQQQQQQQQRQQQQQQQSAGGQAASSAAPGRQQSTPLGRGRGRGRGKGQ